VGVSGLTLKLWTRGASLLCPISYGPLRCEVHEVYAVAQPVLAVGAELGWRGLTSHRRGASSQHSEKIVLRNDSEFRCRGCPNYLKNENTQKTLEKQPTENKKNKCPLRGPTFYVYLVRGKGGRLGLNLPWAWYFTKALLPARRRLSVSHTFCLLICRLSANSTEWVCMKISRKSVNGPKSNN